MGHAAGLRNRVARAREHLTVDRVSGSADLAVKFAAIIVAFGAVAVVFFGPNVELASAHQTFIDEATLNASYRSTGQDVPGVVATVVASYNRANVRDLATGTNITGTRLPAARLCEREKELVFAVFPHSVCDGDDSRIGRNFYWERLLIDHVGSDDAASGSPLLDDSGLETAVRNLRAAQYIKVRVLVDNTGHARARNVTVRVPDGFVAPSDRAVVGPISLAPDDPPEERVYETDPGDPQSSVTRAVRGDPGGAPISRFAVAWDRDEAAQTSIVVWIAVAFFLLWLAIVLNDGRLRARARTADQPDARRASSE